MAESPPSAYEQGLIKAMEEIERRISDLTLEKHALARQLTKARADREVLIGVNRKNSVNRILVEKKVVDTINDAGRPCSNKTLYNAALLAHFDLKYNSFRVILYRMREKNVIQSVGRGRWAISTVS